MLVILALVAGIAMPFFSGKPGVAEVRNMARELAAGLNLARSEAIMRGRDVALHVDLVERSFGLEDQDYHVALPPYTVLEVTTATSETVGRGGNIRFYPNGSSTGGSVSVAANGTRFVVAVDWLTGKVVIRE